MAKLESAHFLKVQSGKLTVWSKKAKKMSHFVLTLLLIRFKKELEDLFNFYLPRADIAL